MFSRVFDTAKRVFSRSPSASGTTRKPVESPPRSLEADTDAEAAMVTTRRGTDTPGASTPRSSVKKSVGKRELTALQGEETPSAAKRRRKSVGKVQQPTPQEVSEAPPPANEAPKIDGDGNPIYENIVLSMPDRTKETTATPEPEGKSPLSRRSPKVLIQKKSSPLHSPEKSPIRGSRKATAVSAQVKELRTPAAPQSSSVFTTPPTHFDRRTSPTPRIDGQMNYTTPALVPKSREEKLVAGLSSEDQKFVTPKTRFPDEIPSSTWESEHSPIPTQDSVPASPPRAQHQHKRFGSEDPPEIPEMSEVPMVDVDEPQPDDHDDAASDSDEAPEVVTAASATSKALATASKTTRAHLAQEAKEQARKERRAARLAEEQAEKRKREEKKARRLSKIRAREERALQPAANVSANEPLDIDVRNLPALLPDSLLEAVSDRRAETPPPVQTGKTAEQLRNEKMRRHIKFLERGEKPIKDVKKGSLHVSVLAQQNALLPPKVERGTRKIREEWLKGRRVEKSRRKGKRARFEMAKVKRKHIGGGFLRGGDD